MLPYPDLNIQEKVGLPKNAQVLKEGEWTFNFTSAGGERGAQKMETFKKDFPDIKTEGWETDEGPID